MLFSSPFIYSVLFKSNNSLQFMLIWKLHLYQLTFIYLIKVWIIKIIFHLKTINVSWNTIHTILITHHRKWNIFNWYSSNYWTTSRWSKLWWCFIIFNCFHSFVIFCLNLSSNHFILFFLSFSSLVSSQLFLWNFFILFKHSFWFLSQSQCWI